MKKFAAVLLVLAMVFGVVACGADPAPAPEPAPAPAPEPAPEPAPVPEPPPAADLDEPGDESAWAGSENDPSVTLRYAEVNPLDSLMGSTASEFKRVVEELTGGTVSVDIQHSGTLGSEPDVLDSMLGNTGIVDMSRISAFSLTQYGAERSTLLSVPFTWEGRPHFWNYAQSDLAQEFLLEPHVIGLGVRGLFYLEEGFRSFFTSVEVDTMADLNGLKLRVPPDPVMSGMTEAVGAIATVLSFGELYSGLQTGVVDGAEQPIVNYIANSFHEVAPYMILNQHTLGAAQVIMTDDAWDSLTERQQAAVMEAGRQASVFNRGMSEQFEKEAIAQGEAEGVTFIPVTNVQEWRDAAADVIATAIAGLEDYYQEILAMS